MGLLGGDSDLSARGKQYARALPIVVAQHIPNSDKLTVSCLRFVVTIFFYFRPFSTMFLFLRCRQPPCKPSMRLCCFWVILHFKMHAHHFGTQL